MQFHSLSVAVVTACAVAAPHVNPNDITHHDVDRAIAQISNELVIASADPTLEGALHCNKFQ